jgi:hypothetical protein
MMAGLGLNIVKKMKKAGSSMFLASPSGQHRESQQDMSSL